MKKKVFTFFELLVSISIIAILVALGTVAYSNAQRKARNARRLQDLRGMQTVMEQAYDGVSGAYPAAAPAEIAGFVDPKPSDYSYECDCDQSYGYSVCVELEDADGNSASDTGLCSGTVCTIPNGTAFECLVNAQ